MTGPCSPAKIRSTRELYQLRIYITHTRYCPPTQLLAFFVFQLSFNLEDRHLGERTKHAKHRRKLTCSLINGNCRQIGEDTNSSYRSRRSCIAITPSSLRFPPRRHGSFTWIITTSLFLVDDRTCARVFARYTHLSFPSPPPENFPSKFLRTFFPGNVETHFIFLIFAKRFIILLIIRRRWVTHLRWVRWVSYSQFLKCGIFLFMDFIFFLLLLRISYVYVWKG